MEDNLPSSFKLKSFIQGLKDFYDNFPVGLRVLLLIVVIAILLTGGFYLYYSNNQNQGSPQPVAEKPKTWELILSYQTKLKLLTFKKLTLLDQRINADNRDQGQSLYSVEMVNKTGKVIYQSKIAITEEIIFNILGNPKSAATAGIPQRPEEIESIVYLPYQKEGAKIYIKKGDNILFEISIEEKNNGSSGNGNSSLFDLVPEVKAQEAPLSCKPLQAVFISDNFTDFSAFHDFVDELIDIFQDTEPFASANPRILDFKVLENSEPLGCQNGIIQCISSAKIEQVGRAAYPDATKFIVIANSPNAAQVDNSIGGVADGPGGKRSVFTNRTDFPHNIQIDAAVHEFLGHSVGGLYDRYVVNPQSIPNYGGLLEGNRSNCTDKSSGEVGWPGGYYACQRPIWYAPEAVNCSVQNPQLLSGGNRNSVMSALGCANSPSFDITESNWIIKNVIPLYQQGCDTATPVPTTQASPSPEPTTPPASDCDVIDAYWRPPYVIKPGELATFEVKTTGDCSDEDLGFVLEEDDGNPGPSNDDDNDVGSPADVEIVSNTMVGTWTGEISRADEPEAQDVFEYFISASVVGGNSTFVSTSSTNAGKLISIDPNDYATPAPTPTAPPNPGGGNQATPKPTAKPSPSPKIYTCVEVPGDVNGDNNQVQLKRLQCTAK